MQEANIRELCVAPSLVLPVLLLFLLFLHAKVVQTVLPLLLIVMVVIMIVEGYFVGRRVTTLANERFPGQSTRGIKMYAAMRALQIRKLRFPKPRVGSISSTP